MKVGKLVRGLYQDNTNQPDRVGIIVDDGPSVVAGKPPTCKVFWPSGRIEEEWVEDLEVVDGNR